MKKLTMQKNGINPFPVLTTKRRNGLSFCSAIAMDFVLNTKPIFANIQHTEDLVRHTRNYSRHMHKGQMYGEEDYFTGHIEEVVKEVKLLGADREDLNLLISLAYCHDLKEDVKVSAEEFVFQGFQIELWNLVEILSHQNGQRPFEYINAVTSDIRTLIVKIADVKVNLRKSEVTNDEKRIVSYRHTLRYLLYIFNTLIEKEHLK